MKIRLKFLCFVLLLLSTIGVPESKADIDYADWGEIVENNSYINIQVEDTNVIVHKRIEMKLRKLLSDDYLYTFTTLSLFGQLKQGSFFVINPSWGIKDSVSESGLKLDYLSQVSIEDTMEISFEYEFEYPNQDVGKIIYNSTKRTARHDYTYGLIIDTNACFDIVCNRKIELQQRWYSSADWTVVGEGTHIVYHPGYYYNTRYLDLMITFSDFGKTDTITEKTYFDVTPEHWQNLPNLIKKESIAVEFTEKDESIFNYCLNGTIELDVEAASRYAPFYAWFPNDQTNAVVELDAAGLYYYDYNAADTTRWHNISFLKVERSVLDGQKGFYILIPQLMDSSYGYVSKCDRAKLTVEIEGAQTEKSCDFILVTAPQEYSSVKFNIPRNFSFRNCYSPFEGEIEFQEEEFQAKKFYGKCVSTGIAHVEWEEAIPISPENPVLFQNHPNPFNQETVIRYALPRDCRVKLSVFNLLGERVQILVNQRQEKDAYEIKWDGKDEQGQNVASGIYFYRIEAGEFSESKKMVVVK